MMRFIIRVIFILGLSLPSFGAYQIHLNFKLDEGKINIQVPKVEFTQNSLVINGARNRCIGLCFSFGGGKKKSSFDQTKRDAYFFLMGNPDDMEMYYFQALCTPNGMMTGYIGNNYSFDVMRGEISLNAILVTGAAMRNLPEQVISLFIPKTIAQTEMRNYICSEEFRSYLSEYRLDSLNPVRLEQFEQSLRRNKIRVRWDPEAWEYEVDKEAWDLLKEVRELIRT